MSKLGAFDAFPKTEEEHVKKSTRGGLSSILTYLFLLFMIYNEVGRYFGGFIEQQYIVDIEIQERAQINFDIFLNTTCDLIDVRIVDLTSDNMKRSVSDEISFEDLTFYIPYGTRINILNGIYTTEFDEVLTQAIPYEFGMRIDERPPEDDMPNINACHLFGSVDVNRLPGILEISTNSTGNINDNGKSFAHVINELSFGEFFPFIDNPLDNTAKVLPDQPLTTYSYYLTVIPTIYEKLGKRVNTNQYSLNEFIFKHIYNVKSQTQYDEAIRIHYDFDALSIFMHDTRLDFIQFLVRLVAILSFVVYIASWVFRFIDKALILLLGPRWSLMYEPVSQRGLLD
ncbi:uncharacterized protein NDAI_0J02760 [Naumovozyma dairenensis CBS 421]|uniref:Endoplasmic reticulum-Golgi intermediate compartment protein n=1 Tax=Naumovozyma dairenensis (strain ATCC 10597 / BCRC 20456 / CBS 421 / NBRC 0211 / NRRL Y-12639) TaxID=1071378 RepID=G0WH90_NAUDC|nr:hypothetical protein NDAI_0J02760 [Naumovozyma dairenensis CBS 421]CCD27168.1 hypothetical protein NDAI_0J02760 [Naumovozyma dairenensis CBS 421]